MAKIGKRLKKAYEGLDPEAPPVRVEDAVKQVKSRASAKFDETVEIAMNLNIDPRKPDQNLRGTAMLPHGRGKRVRVAVWAPITRGKPSGVKGTYIKRVSLTSTMGPAVKVEVAGLTEEPRT